MDKKYVILTTRHRDMFFGGDVHLFWGPDGSGYTAVLQTAGLYDFEEASKIASDDDIPIDIANLGLNQSDFGFRYGDIDIAKVYRKTDRSKKLMRQSIAFFEDMPKAPESTEPARAEKEEIA